MKSLAIALLLSISPAIASAEGEVLICEFGDTMIITVPREEYEEEPNSILKIIIWNSLTATDVDASNCGISDIAVVTYDHTTNEETIDGVLVKYEDTSDFVTVTPTNLYMIEDQNREIEEFTREIFYVYELGLS